MQVILLNDVDKLGYKFDVVAVKPGFGRNYLIPQGKALMANSSNIKRLEEMKRREARSESAKLGEYQAMAKKMTDAKLSIGAKAGKEGKIFGSVTTIQIVQALKEQLDIDIERRKVVMPEDVKHIGDYEATLNLHPEVTTTIKFSVVQE
jgi:large subunit ribosomal protein L9